MELMDSDLVLFDYEWREGDRVKAKEIAIAYVNRRRDELARIFGNYSRDDLVGQVEALRNEKRHADRIIVDMWLLSEYEPQQIIGTLNINGKQLADALGEAFERGEKI